MQKRSAPANVLVDLDRDEIQRSGFELESEVRPMKENDQSVKPARSSANFAGFDRDVRSAKEATVQVRFRYHEKLWSFVK